MKTVLDRLETEGNLRRLCEVQINRKFIRCQNNTYLNLSSNDYLGLSDSRLQADFFKQADVEGHFVLGNPASRLMTGNSPEYGMLEASIAGLFGRESLVLGSGYLANIGILPAVTRPGDLILADKRVHASIIDGLQFCKCEWTRFRHNDTEHLEHLLKKHGNARNIVVVTESVFSMDGDMAPLARILELKERYGFQLYVDEAHAFGVFGKKGAGVAEMLGISDEIEYIVATMGKALASQGAFVVCGKEAKQFLVNTMRPLIFSTALPPISLMWSDFLIRMLPRMNDKREHLACISETVRKNTGNTLSQSHIIPLIAGENEKAIELSDRLKAYGYWACPIRYPTVPKGTARVRISLNASFTEEETSDLTEKINRLCGRNG